MSTLTLPPTVTGEGSPPATSPADPAPQAPRPGRLSRFVRGRPADPAWVRPALLLLLASTAGLYLWGLGGSGWANSFYSAAVQAGTKSWKAFFFGSSDASNFITVDKPPASLWVMEISARMFGVNSWSILVPQALEGVATVGLLYVTVRRWFSPAAGLIAGAVLAITPVATLMFRFNNPDALLVLLVTGAAYATVRAVESGRTRWLVLVGTLLGLGFITKMLQAFIVVPVFGLVYLFAARPSWWRKIGQLSIGGAAMLLAGGWWVAIVELIPAADRPYIGGSQNNSLFNLIFGYNGFGRLTGNETGSVVGGRAAAAGGSMWGPTGWNRLFLSSMGGQISWLIPGALVLLVGCLWLTRRAPRHDRTRAAMLLFGGWLLLTGAVFSFSSGIIHPYYTVALAPAIGALVGIGGVTLWQHRHNLIARGALAVALAGTAVWSFVLLDRTPNWFPPLRFVVLIGGLALSAVLVVAPRLRGTVAGTVLAAAVVLGLAAPAAYSLDTAATPHSGAIPSAGPSVPGGGFGPGGGGPGGGRAGGGRGGFPTGTGRAGFGTRGLGAGGLGAGGAPGSSTSGFPGGGAGAFGGAPGGGFTPGAGFAPGGTGAGSAGAGGFARRGAAGGGSVGGLLNGSNPDSAIVKALQHDASDYTWVAATVGSNSASGYQLSSGDPVMAIGGFNGTDPAPSLSEFETYVKEKKIHYFIAGGGGVGPGGAGGGSGDGSAITTWVEAHFHAETIGGVEVYILSTSLS
jgi:4-amino-4-deoxy-L-arabinose transferase-like glycosyltransferase